eukprot:CAMPEP_0204333958 /NCGR_PEP_ID=MMETSP0469-20131031/17646_1 /ASSEMBLY_ACC=CAM_ASM_000384 /TAXON_ID=2969 /ORGANISM="Oxyrrhis marina" /LENGTH=62 /DNA_ID=CAMNT_0051317397 /DNA_START=71 /DNA_END=259 /DNA_ORIENTATION=-
MSTVNVLQKLDEHIIFSLVVSELALARQNVVNMLVAHINYLFEKVQLTNGRCAKPPLCKTSQ